jgi:hypothetical protein
VRQKGKRCAVAKIGYRNGAPDNLIYIKPMMLGHEPPDVVSYAQANPAFPHESTTNQWFSESQTESYRVEGKLTVDEICRGFDLGRQWDRNANVATLRTT